MKKSLITLGPGLKTADRLSPDMIQTTRYISISNVDNRQKTNKIKLSIS